MIKCIIFDLGRVLVPFDFNRAWVRMEALSGLSAVEIRRRVDEACLFLPFESGITSPEEFIARMNCLLKIDLGEQEFSAIWNSIFLPETLVREELLQVLAEDYRLVLLSNTNVIHFRFLQKNYPLLRHFHQYVLSYEAGVMKPAAEIYQKAIDAAGCLPEECLFFDDIRENVEGAELAGINAVLFTSGRQPEAELRARGII